MDTAAPAVLIPPYGGRLVDLFARGEERESLLKEAGELPSIQLSPAELCDLELLATGALSPLDRFMGKADFDRTVEEMRLAGGGLFPVPVALRARDAAAVSEGRRIALRSQKNEPLASMHVEEVFESGRDGAFLSGPLKVLNLPAHYDFPGLRRTPAEVRSILERFGRSNVVAYQTPELMYRPDEERTKLAAERLEASLLLQSVAAPMGPGDIEYFARVRACLALYERRYDAARTVLSLLPLAARTPSPREILGRAILARNYGANYLLPAPEESHEGLELLARLSGETGIRLAPVGEMVYLPEERRYVEAAPGRKTRFLSAAQARGKYLAAGRSLPDWFVRAEVASALASVYPPRRHQGFCVWFTGLPSAGKSTLAEILAVMLMERGRRVTVLDGDVVRTHLSKGLGFSKEDRDTNILRIGFVASEIARHHGAVLCAAVSPYRAARDQVRDMVGEDRFLLVWVATPAEVCEQRDVKRLYARARAGELKGFTGVDDPYEPPDSADLVLDTMSASPQESAAKILHLLAERGFLGRRRN